MTQAVISWSTNKGCWPVQRVEEIFGEELLNRKDVFLKQLLFRITYTWRNPRVR